MELRTYLEILWRRRWVVVVTFAVTVTIVVIGTVRATPVYVTSTTLRIATSTVGSVNWVDYDVWYAERLLNTYAEIATSGPVLAELQQRVGLDEPPQVEAEALPNTELIRITVQDPSPVRASEAANTLAEILIAYSRQQDTQDRKAIIDILDEQLTQLEDELTQARQEFDSLVVQNPGNSQRIAAASRSIELREEAYLRLLERYEQARVREVLQVNVLSVIEPAVIPQTPSKPRRELNIALGAMVGLGGGVGLAFLFDILKVALCTMSSKVGDE
jgi:succinoglycan biosynthesis transport protein ExoP